jgi:NAD dependent epimerase/dehydratase family enzyme
MTHALATALAESDNKPRSFLLASAIGFYGEAGEFGVDEKSPVGSNFLAEIAQA